jgi:hypothetical protein
MAARTVRIVFFMGLISFWKYLSNRPPIWYIRGGAG